MKKATKIEDINFPIIEPQPPIIQRVRIKQDELPPDQIIKIKITPTLPTQTTVGIIESDGTNIWWTDSTGTRKQLDN